MRLKIRRLLKGGLYSVSFESLGFNPAESERIKEYGMPSVDLQDMGLGTPHLDQLNFMIRCRDAQEADDIIRRIRQRAKEELADLLARSENLGLVGRTRTSKWGKVSILSIACAVVFLLLTAYKGVISSQQSACQQEQTSRPVGADVSELTTAAVSQISHSSAAQSYRHDFAVQPETDIDYQQSTLALADLPASKTELAASAEPNFSLTVIPQVLASYSDWGCQGANSEDLAGSRNFKLILTPSGDLQGPVTLAVLGGSSTLKARLFPEKVAQLPGSSTLIISVPPKSPPQICPEITVVARAQTTDGALITHEKRVSVEIRQRSLYRGPVWHVSVQGSDQSGDGSYGSPFRTIQRAMDCSGAGDTVLVDKGLYCENVSLIDKERLLVASRLIFDGEESTISSTIIEARSLGWVVTVGRSKDITLRGFTIQRGKGQNGSLGGGIYCYNSFVSILDNIVTDNRNHSGYGAGIYCYESQPTIMRNRITGNSNLDGHGAAIYCYRSDPDIRENIFSGNCASGGGSAVHLLEPTFASIVRNLIHHESGSACIVLYNKGRVGDFRMANNTISHNQGDAVRIFGGPWNLDNNVITQNNGYGVYTLGGTVDLYHNDVWANVSGNDTTNFCGLGRDPTAINGNISEDPLFGNPIHGNFRLCLGSPCINSGSSSAPVPPGGGQRVDMGAFEYTFPKMICGDVNRDGTVDYGDIESLSGYLAGRIQIVSPLETCDLNHDSEIDRRDLTDLYESMYFYAPDPCGKRKSKDRLTRK